MDLTEAEDIKQWKEYTELYKKELHDPDNHDGMITHLDPDILECKVKWALGSTTTNKASGVDGIQVELFQILKDHAVKVLHSVIALISHTSKVMLKILQARLQQYMKREFPDVQAEFRKGRSNC